MPKMNIFFLFFNQYGAQHLQIFFDIAQPSYENLVNFLFPEANFLAGATQATVISFPTDVYDHQFHEKIKLNYFLFTFKILERKVLLVIIFFISIGF
jgi:hypothetical protein